MLQLMTLLLTSSPLARPRGRPADPPTGDDLTFAFFACLAFTIVGVFWAREAWTKSPEEIDRKPFPGTYGRAGLAGIPIAIGMPVVWVGMAIQLAVGSASGVLVNILPTLGISGLLIGGVYVMAYFWVRLPDALLPPPQRGRGGQWNDADGNPAR